MIIIVITIIDDDNDDDEEKGGTTLNPVRPITSVHWKFYEGLKVSHDLKCPLEILYTYVYTSI